MSEDVAVDPQATVSVEHEGRTLSGVGVESARLTDTMERRAPVEEEARAADAQPTAAEPQPRPTRGQARFSELTQKAKDAEARTAALQAEFDEFKAKFRDPTVQAPAAPQASHPPLAARSEPVGPERGDSGQLPPTRPEPTEDEVGTKYSTYGEFVKDQAQWVWEQQQHKLSDLVRQQLVQQRSEQEFMSQVESTRAKGRSAYKDFDMLLQHGAGASVNMPPGALHAIYQLPNSEHVQYAIMKDGALAQRLAWIAHNQPHAFGLELAKIAPAAPAVSTASTGTPGPATPPAPMQPVGSGSPTTNLSSADLVKGHDYDKSGYREKRAAELRRFRRTG